MSSEIACRAASFTSAGAGKSGNPCERLTALCFSARRVISRMTDSVNCSAFAESMRRAICAMEDSDAVITLKSKVYGRREKKQRRKNRKERRKEKYSPEALKIRRESGKKPLARGLHSANGDRGDSCRRDRRAGTVDHAVDFGVAQHDLHVVARFGERDRLDELGNFFVIAFAAPQGDAIFAGIERGQRVFRSTRAAKQAGNIHHADLQIKIWLEQFVFGVAHLELASQQLAGFGKHLHQADRVLGRNGRSLERGLLANQARGEHRIESIFGGLAA